MKKALYSIDTIGSLVEMCTGFMLIIREKKKYLNRLETFEAFSINNHKTMKEKIEGRELKNIYKHL